MKIMFAGIGLALAGLSLSAPAARAESTYWQDRWEGRGYYDPQAYPKLRHRRDHPDLVIRKRAEGMTAEERRARRSYNGPVYQSQEEVQQSVYEFSTGGFGNIKSYR